LATANPSRKDIANTLRQAPQEIESPQLRRFFCRNCGVPRFEVHMKRRTALGVMFLAGCGGAERILSPRSKGSYYRTAGTLSEIWVVPTSSGTQEGTQANPFATPTHVEFDALMRSYASVDPLIVHLNNGDFYTIGTREWNDTNDVQQNPGFRMGRQWTFTSETNATLHWAVDAVPDDRIDDTPIWLILTTEARFDANLNNHTPVDVWNLRPRGQTVRNLTFDLQFAAAKARWQAKGKTLRIGAVHLGGHQAAIENSTVLNWGALVVEAFPFYIQGATGKYDRDLIAQLDPAQYIYDAGVPDAQCSHITGCRADGYVQTQYQVTVNFIAGSIGERTPGQWIQHMRAFAYQTGNTTIARRPNMVQAHTLYQCLRGKVASNYAQGITAGYYGDFYATKGVEIQNNQFIDCYHGVQLLLSPGGPGYEQYSHENYAIGPNTVQGNGPNVLLDTLGASTATRYIRNITVDANLTLVNNGATNVTRTGGTGGNVTVSITGPQYVTRYQSAQYFATPAGGTAPYTYEWRSRQCTDSQGYSCFTWQNWYSTGSQNYTYASINGCGLSRNELQARVTDAQGRTATSPTYPIWITNPC
jgi:hypothetical protein